MGARTTCRRASSSGRSRSRCPAHGPRSPRRPARRASRAPAIVEALRARLRGARVVPDRRRSRATSSLTLGARRARPVWPRARAPLVQILARPLTSRARRRLLRAAPGASSGRAPGRVSWRRSEGAGRPTRAGPHGGGRRPRRSLPRPPRRCGAARSGSPFARRSRAGAGADPRPGGSVRRLRGPQRLRRRRRSRTGRRTIPARRLARSPRSRSRSSRRSRPCPPRARCRVWSGPARRRCRPSRTCPRQGRCSATADHAGRGAPRRDLRGGRSPPPARDRRDRHRQVDAACEPRAPGRGGGARGRRHRPQGRPRRGDPRAASPRLRGPDVRHRPRRPQARRRPERPRGRRTATWSSTTSPAVFKRIYEPWWGPRTDDIMRAACLTLAQIPGATLAEVPLLLTDFEWRRAIRERLADVGGLSAFWSWYERLPEQQRAQHIAPLLNKLRAFLLRGPVRAIVGQAKPKRDIAGLSSTRAGCCSSAFPKGTLGRGHLQAPGRLRRRPGLAGAACSGPRSRGGRPPGRGALRGRDAQLPGAAALVRGPARRGARLPAVARARAPAHGPAPEGHARRPGRERQDQGRLHLLPRGRASPSRATSHRSSAAHDLSHLATFQAACRPCVGGGQAQAFTFRTVPLPPGSPPIGQRRSGGGAPPCFAAARDVVEERHRRRQLEPVTALLPPSATRPAGGPAERSASDPASAHPSGHHGSDPSRAKPPGQEAVMGPAPTGPTRNAARARTRTIRSKIQSSCVIASPNEISSSASTCPSTGSSPPNQLYELHFPSIQRARARLLQLHQLGVLWRTRRTSTTRVASLALHPRRARRLDRGRASRGSSHGEVGYRNDRKRTLVDSPRLEHTRATNGFFTRLIHVARSTEAPFRVAEWRGEAWCARRWQTHVRPDGFARLEDAGRTSRAAPRAGPRNRASRSARGQDGALPGPRPGGDAPDVVLFCFPSEAREASARHVLGGTAMPVATATLDRHLADPFGAIWLPLDADRRVRVIDLGTGGRHERCDFGRRDRRLRFGDRLSSSPSSSGSARCVDR